MRKTVKKLTAVGLTVTSVLGLVACGSSKGTTSQGTSENKEVTKPDTFTVMCDGTVVTETNGAEAFYKQLNEATGLDIKWTRPDHASYYDAVANAFNSDDTMPDVVLLSSDYYALYASNGFLWNMTDAWEHSETKNSGRLISTADNVLSALMVNGEDGTKAMYGLSLYRGNGCCTYVKKAWLDKAGIDASKVKDVQMDFNTYYGYLKQMAPHCATGMPDGNWPEPVRFCHHSFDISAICRAAAKSVPRCPAVGASRAVARNYEHSGREPSAHRRIAAFRFGAERRTQIPLPGQGTHRTAARPQRRLLRRGHRAGIGGRLHLEGVRRNDHQARHADDRQFERFPHGRRRSPGGSRSKPRRRPERPPAYYRQPQLHDDSNGRGTQRARKTLAHPPRARSHLPVGQRRRRTGDGRTGRAARGSGKRRRTP